MALLNVRTRNSIYATDGYMFLPEYIYMYVCVYTQIYESRCGFTCVCICIRTTCRLLRNSFLFMTGFRIGDSNMLSQKELHRSLQVHMYICICICVRVLLLAVTLPYCFMPVDFAHFFMFRDYYSGYLFRFLVWGDILRTCEHVHVYGCTHVCPFLDDDAGYMYMC